MADEKTTADEKSAVEDFSDEALTNALEGKAEEKKTETKEEVKPEPEKTEQPVEETATTAKEDPEKEDLDHKENSKLGRKFKGLESKFEQIMSRLDQLAKPAEKEPEIDLPEVITSPEDVEKVIAAREAKSRKEQASQANAQKAYEQGYMKQLSALEEANGDIHDEVMELIQDNAKKGLPEFNTKYSDNPFADARINYAEAKAAIMAKKLAGGGKKVPERKIAEKVPVRPAAAATEATVKTEMTLPKLDGYAADYVAYLKQKGHTESEIATMLKD